MTRHRASRTSRRGIRAGAVLAAALLATVLAPSAPALVVDSDALYTGDPGDPAEDAPLVYAHRGGAEHRPENTLLAFEWAHDEFDEFGVWIEIDVHPTADGGLVVIHDAWLDRTTDCEGAVVETTTADVVQCNAAAHEPWEDLPFEAVPTLQETFEQGKEAGWRLLVELKNIPTEPNFEPSGESMAAELVRLVEQTGFPKDRLVVQSFWPPSLDQVKLLDPELETALLTTSQLPGAPPGVGFSLHQNAIYSTARGYEISAPNYQTPDMSAEVVALAHALGREVVVWTVNDGDDAVTLAGFGVDGIITDDPPAIYEALGITS